MRFDTKQEVIDGTLLLVVRPVDKLSDIEYDQIKPYIETMGGHWRERVKGFVFNLEEFKRTTYADWIEEMQFFPTPKSVAERIVELAGLKDFDFSTVEYGNIDTYPFILEPSAGHGDLLDAVDSHLRKIMREYVVEVYPLHVGVLQSKGHRVETMSFERFYELHKKDAKEITHAIMNPPFSYRRDIRHTKMAYDLLKEGGVLVAVISENALYYDTDEHKEFVEWLKEHNAEVENVPYGSFKESGTAVDTVIIKLIKE